MGTFWKASAGAGQEELLLKFQISGAPLDWSRDGRSILHSIADAKIRQDLAILPVTGDRKLVPLVQTEFNERDARFSPDGRFVAYSSDGTGRYEVYIQPVPPTGAKWPVSSGGARQPEWRRDGKELYYIAPDRKLMAVAVTTGPKFEAGAPRALFETRVAPYTGITGRSYAVTADGRRFLINTEMEAAASKPAPITVVVNWQAGVSK